MIKVLEHHGRPQVVSSIDVGACPFLVICLLNSNIKQDSGILTSYAAPQCLMYNFLKAQVAFSKIR